MNTPPRKQPVQPWKPQPQRAMVSQQVVVVVRENKEKSADAPLRAAWFLSKGIFFLGLITAVAILIAGSGRAGEVGAAAGVIGMITGVLGWLLVELSGLAVLVLAIVAMVRGSAGRGLLAIGGYVLACGLAVGMCFGAGALADRQNREKRDEARAQQAAEERARAAERKTAEVQAARGVERPIGPLLAPEPAKVMTLTNNKGVTITATVLWVDENRKVKLTKDGTPFEIDLMTLDAPSRAKVLNWQAGK